MLVLHSVDKEQTLNMPSRPEHGSASPILALSVCHHPQAIFFMHQPARNLPERATSLCNLRIWNALFM